MSRPEPAVIFILITLTLDAIGFGLILPVMPLLLQEVTGGDIAQAALWAGIMLGGFAVMQFLCGPVLGNLSDRFGRRPVLLASIAVLTLDYVILALASTIWMVLAARLLTGAASSTMGTANAYLADISTPEQKARRFGLVGAAFGLGFVLGPALGGLLAGWGTRAPFIAAACVAGANLAFGALVLRESLAPANRRPFRWARANPLGAFRHIGRLPGLGRYLTIYGIHEFAFFVFPTIWAYFGIARFGWTPGQVGLSLAFYGISFAVVQGGLVGPAIRILGRHRTMMMGTASGIVSLCILTVIDSGAMALALIPLSAMGGFVLPALRAELSDRVSASQQGELQGAMASLRAMGMIAAPLAFTTIFAAFTVEGAWADLPGAPFALAALLNLGVLALLLSAQSRGGAAPAVLSGTAPPGYFSQDEKEPPR
jgi:MFS transporter, DHA1 family, tetracycline resistance protein